MKKTIINKKAILFVCELNAIRSPIAEYYMKFNYDCSQTLIDSCGFNVSYKDYLTIQVMSEIGINMENHIPKNFNQLNLDKFDIIVSFSEEIFNYFLKLYENKTRTLKFIDIPITNFNGSHREQKILSYRIIRDKIIKEITINFNNFFK